MLNGSVSSELTHNWHVKINNRPRLPSNKLVITFIRLMSSYKLSTINKLVELELARHISH